MCFSFAFRFDLGAALGGDGYWASGLHLYSPLPFLYHRDNLMSHVRLHYFLNAGNVFNTQSIRKSTFFLSLVFVRIYLKIFIRLRFIRNSLVSINQRNASIVWSRCCSQLNECRST